MTEAKNKIRSTERGSSALPMLILCIACLIVNLAGAWIASLLKFPLYLDTVGTIVTAVTGGYLPGVIVGFATNMIKSLIESPNIYYGVLNTFTAVIAAAFARKGFYKGFVKPIATIPVIAFVTGSLGAVLSWYLYGTDILQYVLIG